MEGMTPEERFTRMENLLAAVIENQAKHDAGIRDLIAVSRAVVDSQKQTTAQIDALTSDISELRGAIDDLRESQRESQKEFQAGQQELREAQKATEDKLHALIETVDRIIRQK
jgi:hypothetical protein